MERVQTLVRNAKFISRYVMSRHQEFEYDYSDNIVDESLLLLGNIFKGQTGPHIDRKMGYFRWPGLSRGFGKNMLRVLAPGQAQSLAS